MKCPYCAEEIEENSRFCEFCQRDLARDISISETLFSLKGRIGRKTFWLTLFVLELITGVFSYVFNYIDELFKYSNDLNKGSFALVFLLAAFSIGLILFWIRFSIMVKRVHDLEHSAWYLLFYLVPIVNIVIGWEIAFSKGTEGPNIYGLKTDSNVECQPPNRKLNKADSVQRYSKKSEDISESLTSLERKNPIENYNDNQESTNTNNADSLCILSDAQKENEHLEYLENKRKERIRQNTRKNKDKQTLIVIFCVTIFLGLTIWLVSVINSRVTEASLNSKNNQDNSPNNSMAYVEKVPPTLTEPPIKTNTPVPTQTMKVVENWRISIMSEATGLVVDRNADTYWINEVASQARNLAVANPYRWEVYFLPKDKNFLNVSNYYLPIMKNKGFRQGIYDFNENIEIGLMTFTSIEMKIIIQYWKNGGNNIPMVIGNL